MCISFYNISFNIFAFPQFLQSNDVYIENYQEFNQPIHRKYFCFTITNDAYNYITINDLNADNNDTVQS